MGRLGIAACRYHGNGVPSEITGNHNHECHGFVVRQPCREPRSSQSWGGSCIPGKSRHRLVTRFGWLFRPLGSLVWTNCGTLAAQVVNRKFDQEDKFRQLDEILPTPNVYRTASGAPGHEYWRQQANYDIDVKSTMKNNVSSAGYQLHQQVARPPMRLDCSQNNISVRFRQQNDSNCFNPSRIF